MTKIKFKQLSLSIKLAVIAGVINFIVYLTLAFVYLIVIVDWLRNGW